MKTIIYQILLTIIFCGCVLLLSKTAVDELETSVAKYKKHLGENYIIKKDTLMIVDYSLLKSVFILSDQTEVHYKIICKCDIKE